MRPLFVRRPRTPIPVILVGFLSIVLMSVDYHRDYLKSTRNLIATAFYPLYLLVNWPTRAGEWLSEQFTTRQRMLEQNTQLRKEQLHARYQLRDLDETKAENQRLRALLNSSPKFSDRILMADLISVHTNSITRRLVLNKGSRDDVFAGQALVDSSGIMGQVLHVTPFYSQVLLITDPDHALPVQVLRNGLRSVAHGAGSRNLLKLSHIPNNTDVRTGDLIVTSGLGGRFPSGYPVGVVTNVQRNRGRPFAVIYVQPSAMLERNRQALLVWPGRIAQDGHI